MEQHCIVSENTLLSKGLQHYLEIQRQAQVASVSVQEANTMESACLRSIQFLWIDVIHEIKALVKLSQKMIHDHPRLKVFVFGEFKDPQTIKSIFKSGISGYFLPNCCPQSIREAIQKADMGSPYIDPKLTEIFLEGLFQTHHSPAARQQLTKREKQILRLIVEEYTTQEIANKLFISFCTVETHRLHLIQKMGVRNTAGLVREAVSSNLVD